MDYLAARSEREQALAEYQTCARDAYLDAGFAAEMEEWDAAEDDIDLDDLGRPA